MARQMLWETSVSQIVPQVPKSIPSSNQTIFIGNNHHPELHLEEN